jgi:hypothetical protein
MSQIIEANPEPLWTQIECAQFLKLDNHKTLAAWPNRRQGPPYIRVGTCIRYAPATVRTWLESRTVTCPA